MERPNKGSGAYEKGKYIELRFLQKRGDKERRVILFSKNLEGIPVAKEREVDKYRVINPGPKLVYKVPHVMICYEEYYDAGRRKNIYPRTHLFWIEMVETWISLNSTSSEGLIRYAEDANYSRVYLPNNFMGKALCESFLIPDGEMSLEEILHKSNSEFVKRKKKINCPNISRRPEPDWDSINARFRR